MKSRLSKPLATLWLMCSTFAALHAVTAAAAPVLPAISEPATHKHVPGKFIWFDLVAADTAAAQRFYGAVFDWKFQSVRGSAEHYAVIRNEGTPIGGVFRSSDAASGARWLSYASVADMDNAIFRMTAGGAQVLVPATQVAGRGRHAVLRDVQGAIVGLLQSASGDRVDAPVAPGEFFWVDLYARDAAAAARVYQDLGYDISSDEISGDDRLLLAAGGYARAGIMQLPEGASEAGWLAYVQVDDVPATLARVRAAGGKILREPDPKILNGQLAVLADPQGGVLGVMHWPSDSEEAQQ